MLLHSRISPALPSARALDVPPPSARRRRMRTKRWLAWTLAISLLLHLLALIAILYVPHTEEEDARATAPAEWQIEMQPDHEASAPPPSTVAKNPQPNPPQPSASKEVVKPQPRTEQTPPPPPPAATPAKPEPTTSPPVLASRNGIEPTPDKPSVAKPAPKPSPSPFANMQESKDYFLPRRAPPPPAKSDTPAERGGLNLALGKIERYDMAQPNRRNNDLDADVQVSGAAIGPDWLQQLHVWWIDHRRYPQEALRNFQQGDVVIRFDVDRSGLTSNAEIVQHSPSQWLDAQTMATFGHAHLPPLPPETKEDHKTITITVRYILN